MHFRQLLGDPAYYARFFRDFVPPIKKSTIYLYEDSYGCNYIYFLLAASEELLLSPYLSQKWKYRDVRQTDLQVQTVAQHCDILDIHYFSRVFKKYTSKECRNSCRKGGIRRIIGGIL